MVSLVALSAACAEEQGKSGAPSASGSASAKPVASASAVPTVSATPPAPTPPPPPPHDCPKGTAGDGTLAKPCEAKGLVRAMEVTWTGKTDDKGPQFRVINKMKETILYAKLVAYFYDKAGKQLDVKDSAGKTRPNQACLGNIFAGVMKPDEKAVMWFSCVKKEHVPEGTATVEAEVQTVGFADATEKKSEYFWRNSDLTPDVRPKGGIKK